MSYVMKYCFVFVVSVLSVACGGEERPPADWRMAGVWSGTVAIEGQPERVAVQEMLTTVRDTLVRAEGICPDGSGVIDLSGEDREAHWRGVLVCPHVAIGQCPSVRIEMNMMSLILENDNAIRMLATGVVTGCGETRNPSLSMLAARDEGGGASTGDQRPESE